MFALFKRKPYRMEAKRLYDQLVTAARNPDFYREYDVPDTVEGRFEMLALHIFMVINRLGNETEQMAEAKAFSQALFDTMFKDMDYSFREAGVGDLSVPKKMKFAMKAFNGRCHAYQAGLAGSDSDLERALLRNVYGGGVLFVRARAQVLPIYVRRSVEDLAKATFPRILAGQIAFPTDILAENAQEKGGPREEIA